MIRWSLNISTLLREYPFLDRFRAAADLGFGAVEFWWPADMDLDAVVKAREDAGIDVALMNADGGNSAAGERGFLGNPVKADYVRANFAQALDLAAALHCLIIHVLGGTAVSGMARNLQLDEAARMQRELCAMAAPHGVTVTLEPQNRWDAPGYMFTTTAEAIDQIERVGAPNLRLQYDVYHMQIMEGNITPTLRKHIGEIAHIQIADPPGRHQPGTGELNFPFILREIQALDYTGYVGLEYFAQDNNTAASVEWLPREQRVIYNA
jgi:hydroxypyruvate isomerase